MKPFWTYSIKSIIKILSLLETNFKTLEICHVKIDKYAYKNVSGYSNQSIYTHVYLECISELVRHHVIKNWIYTRWHIIEYPWDVCERRINCKESRRFRQMVFLRPVYRDKPLGVEWGPAHEERYYYRDC